MELALLYKNLMKHKQTVFLFALIGLLIGFILFYMPSKYYTTGAFFVKRSIDNNPSFFTYEGYYAQQTAVSFTNTVAALIESEDIQSQALRDLGYQVNENTLHKYAKNIKVVKESPQLITLTVKGSTSEESSKLWLALSKTLLETSQKINAQGDSKLSISLVSDQPVVKKAYKSLFINIPAGILAGLMLGIFIISLKDYDK